MAERKRRAPQVRSYLAVIKSKAARKGVSTDELIETLYKLHPEAIRAETADILHIGLIKLANESCSLRSGPATSTQLELFAEYRTAKTILLRKIDAKGRVQRIHKDVDALELIEARQHVEEHTKPKTQPRQTPEIRELSRCIDDVEKYGKSEHSTIGECYVAKKASGK